MSNISDLNYRLFIVYELFKTMYNINMQLISYEIVLKIQK